MRVRRFFARLALPLLLSAGIALPSLGGAEPAANARVAARLVPASDPNFVYEGRFDASNPVAPVVIWQASRIRLEFEGDSLALRFTDAQGQNYFDAEIDGRTTLVAVRAGATADGAAFTGLGPGRHRLMLFKRSEASAGTVRFTGVEIAPGGAVFAPERPPYKLAMQFIGDSITAGACNEDGAADQWDDRRTHNNARSYGAFTAAAFSADYRNIAVSGMGIAIGWTEVKAGEIWNRVYPDSSSPLADLHAWKPDVVFVNLGENDDSFSRAKKISFPDAAYTHGYVALARAIRGAYPAAHIVILRGGMFGGSQSEPLRHAWETAVAQMEAADPNLSHFVFKHWASTHPRVDDHRAMADELIAWLRAQNFMRR